jgi:hypothetical protein
MSYDIYIGNAEPRTEDGEFDWWVAPMTHEDAPAFPNDELSEHANSRHPAYLGWSEFCKATGMYDLLFAQWEGLMRRHPGIHELTQDHAIQIRAALDRWKARYPNAEPGFTGFLKCSAPGEPSYESECANANLARLLWLDWWVQWALANCEHPAIYNR